MYHIPWEYQSVSECWLAQKQWVLEAENPDSPLHPSTTHQWMSGCCCRSDGSQPDLEVLRSDHWSSAWEHCSGHCCGPGGHEWCWSLVPLQSLHWSLWGGPTCGNQLAPLCTPEKEEILVTEIFEYVYEVHITHIVYLYLNMRNARLNFKWFWCG